MSNLRVLGVQFDVVWNQPQRNFELIEAIIDNKEVDLIVLPEMFNTGFCMQPETCAEPMNGLSIKWMQHMAEKMNCAIMGSLAIQEGSHFYNRLVFCKPDGTFDYYNKKHLFSSSDENKVYKSGTSRKLFSWKGWKILGLICYDLRFPELSRNTENFDLCVFVSSWPKKRNYAWEQLLIARAIENQCFVMGVNRIGSDSNGYVYNGPSLLIDFLGKEIDRINETAGCISGVINQNKMRQFRDVFPALRDAGF